MKTNGGGLSLRVRPPSRQRRCSSRSVDGPRPPGGLPCLRSAAGRRGGYAPRRSSAEEFESIYARPETEYLITLGEVHVLAGRCDEARSLVEQAIGFAGKRGLRGVEASSLLLLAEIAAHRNRPNAAESKDYYGQALALAEDLGMRPLAARCHLGLGELYRKNGELEKAKTELTAAAGLFRSMEMTFWLERAENALG